MSDKIAKRSHSAILKEPFIRTPDSHALVLNLVKTTALASVFAILLFPYLIHHFPYLMHADYASLGRGQSMAPTIQDGDLVAVNAAGLRDVEVGDVLAVRFGGLRIVHRLVEIIEGEDTILRLKGDGNERSDPIIFEESQIMGKVIAVYHLNGIYTPSYGYVILLTAAALLLISLWRRPELELNDVLLCLIIALSLGGIIGYRLIGVASQ